MGAGEPGAVCSGAAFHLQRQIGADGMKERHREIADKALPLSFFGEEANRNFVKDRVALIFGHNQANDSLCLFYGRKMLNEIISSGREEPVAILGPDDVGEVQSHAAGIAGDTNAIMCFTYDSRTDSLEYLAAVVQVLKGHCDYYGNWCFNKDGKPWRVLRVGKTDIELFRLTDKAAGDNLTRGCTFGTGKIFYTRRFNNADEQEITVTFGAHFSRVGAEESMPGGFSKPSVKRVLGVTIKGEHRRGPVEIISTENTTGLFAITLPGSFTVFCHVEEFEPLFNVLLGRVKIG